MIIKNRFTGDIIFEDESKTIKETVEHGKTNLSWATGADLSRANLSEADLSRANLSEANLSGANLSEADLSRANLSWADLSGADLSRANLSGANLSWANLSWANLSWANLSGADLSGANLSGANLHEAYLEFYNFPSIRTISSIYLYKLPDNLNLELMRRDAVAHPHPEKFDEWASGGGCPYSNEERFWLFDPEKSIWSPGEPQMDDVTLILEICKSQGWHIRDYLPMPKKIRRVKK